MNSFISLSIASIVLSLMLAWQIKGRYDKHHKYNSFIRLMLAIPIWSFFAVMELYANDGYKVLFSQLSYLGVVSVPVFWFLFSLEYSEKRSKLYYNQFYLWIVPVFVMIVVLTNNFHGMFWSNIYPDSMLDNFVLYKYERGPLYYINILYAYVLFISGLIVFLKTLLNSKIMRDSVLVIMGVVAPFASNIFYIFRITELDYAPAALFFSCFCFAWSIVGGFFERNMAIAEIIHKNMEEGILLIDENYKIISMNPYAQQIIGVKNTDDEVDVEKVITFWDKLKEKLHVNSKEYFEIELGHSYFGIHVYSIAKESTLSGWIMNLIDITDKKQVEKKLEERSIAAEAANIAKSNFVASMSHEIRTPLNGIIGFIDVLSNTNLDKEQQYYLTEMQNASDNLLYMINNVLDFSKIEVSKIEVERVSFNLHQIVEDVVSLFAPKAYFSGTNIHSEIKSDVPVAVFGDPGKIRQVLNNLVGNAVKFTQNGDVVLSVSRISEKNDNVDIMFEVNDTGIGIPPEMILKIFQPFTQADSSTTRKYGGTGLGLSISNKLVQQMGSSINVESVENEGSKFYFYLTLEKASCEIKVIGKKEKSVLIIDSNPIDRRILKLYMDEIGFSVFDTDNCNDDNIFIKKTYDLVIVDIDSFICMTHDITKFKSIENIFTYITIPITKRGKISEINYLGFKGFIPKPLKKDEIKKLFTELDIENEIKHNSKCKETEQSIIDEGQKCILLVEDMEANRKLALIILKKSGYECDIAKNGKEALEICREKKYDLILMDCQMPVMDGYEATRHIKNMGLNKDTPIIAMTANALEGDREKCLESGMDDFITKPIVFKKIDETIKKWMVFDDQKQNPMYKS